VLIFPIFLFGIYSHSFFSSALSLSSEIAFLSSRTKRTIEGSKKRGDILKKEAV